MKKEFVYPASLCASALALCISVYSGYQILHQPVALTSGTTEVQAAAGDSFEVDEVPMPITTPISIKDGNLNPGGCKIPLCCGEEIAAVTLPEDASGVEYDMAQGYLAFDCSVGHIVVSTICASEISGDYARAFESEGEYVITAVREVTKQIGVNLVATTSQDNADAMKEAADAILTSLCACSEYNFSICGLSINPDWDVDIAENVVCLAHEDDRVTVSVYGSSLDNAGFDNTVDVGSIQFLYGNYKDVETGYVPYMYQGEKGTLKVMTTSSEILTAVFASGNI